LHQQTISMKKHRFSLILSLLLILMLVVIFINCSPSISTSSSNSDMRDVTSIPPASFDLSAIPEDYRSYSPLPIQRDYVLDYTGFILEFDTMHRNATWVCYMLCQAKLGDGVERASNFRQERRLGSLSPRDVEYRNSGFDRGHLAPAADMSYSSQSMYDSFFLTNASPQVPSFNRGIWKQLEGKVRDFAIEKDTIWVITGPVLTSALPKIENTNISIPEIYYKVIYKPNIEGGQGIAFLMKNEEGTGQLMNFAVSIDSVEAITGLNFFPLLSPQQEKQIESTFDIDWWFSER